MTSSYGYDTVRYVNMAYDTTTDEAGAFSGVATAPYTMSIALTGADTGTMLGRGYALPASFAVPAGNYVGMTVTFVTGASSYASGDTIENAVGNYLFGDFLPMIKYAGTSSGPVYAPYNPGDYNAGYFESEAISSSSFPYEYIPLWGNPGGTSGVSNLQYPDIRFHVHCTTCTLTDTISGLTQVCVGSNTALSCSPGGGTWSSSSTAIATVGTSGVVTGFSAGVATITYRVSGINITTAVTVDATASTDTINGPSIVCVGSDILLSNTIAGGTWSSSNPATGTINTTGDVTGIAVGTTIISYGITTACGLVAATKTITVSNTTDAGTVLGPTTLYAGGATITVADITGDTGGIWSSSNTSVATIGTSTGIVTGVAAGTAVLTYSVTGCSGPGIATQIDTVLNFDGISGYVNFGSVAYYGYVKVWLIAYNPATLMLQAVDTQSVACAGTSVYYQFTGMSSDSFRVKASVYDTTTGVITGPVPTYHDTSFYWDFASVIAYDSGTAYFNENINMLYGMTLSGLGFIGGSVLTGANRGTSLGIPVVNLNIFAINTTTNAIAGMTTTNSSGAYSFSALPYGTYTIFPDSLNYATTPYANITLSSSTPTFGGASFIQDPANNTITPITTAVKNVLSSTSSVSAFPNPTSGKLNIQWTEKAAEKGTLSISDISGREVYRSTINMTQGQGMTAIDLSGLMNGVYMVNITSASLNYNDKIEVMH